MPFADDPQTDPLTGESGGLLDRQRQFGGVPKVYAINTSAEYWRGDASLAHTDVAGTRDVEPPRGPHLPVRRDAARHRHAAAPDGRRGGRARRPRLQRGGLLAADPRGAAEPGRLGFGWYRAPAERLPAPRQRHGGAGRQGD